ncbi:MAG: hypothetical protein ACOCT7_02890 [Candidatus Saliniplasma sp.]
MIEKIEEDMLEKSKDVCKNVAMKIKERENVPSPLEIKVMIENELGYGLSEEEIMMLAITFRHIDNLIENLSTSENKNNQFMFR